MSMFYLFFGIEKRESFVRKKILLGVEQNSIDMYVGKKHCLCDMDWAVYITLLPLILVFHRF